MSQLKKAMIHTVEYTAAAAFIAVIKFDDIRIHALTEITDKMSKAIMDDFGYGSLKGLAAFSSIATGCIFGTDLATSISVRVPGIGSRAASISTASLHLGIGAMLICCCILLQEGYVSDDDLKDSTFCKALSSRIFANIRTIIFELLRGNPVKFAYLIKNIFKGNL